jgi:hypothetical protein
MMHDCEKSDPAIVAVKLTNKAGQPAAESVEPRAGAEGNVSQQRTGRAQYRGTVSQALKHIRYDVKISRRAVTHPRWGAVCPNWARTDLCGGREVTRVNISSVRRPRPQFLRKPTFACAAISVATGHERTHALQQSGGGFKIGCQACSSPSRALASFRSSVSKPSVNRP